MGCPLKDNSFFGDQGSSMQARLIFRIGWKPEIWAKYTSLQNVGLLEKKTTCSHSCCNVFQSPRFTATRYGPRPPGVNFKGERERDIYIYCTYNYVEYKYIRIHTHIYRETYLQDMICDIAVFL